MTSADRPHVVYVVTHPVTARHLLRGQLAFLSARGFRLTLVVSPGPELNGVAEREGVLVETLPMHRAAAPLSDLLSLLRLCLLLRRLRPAIVLASTPKASLLGLLAAALVGVPHRIYVLRGLRLESAAGWRRRVLATAEAVTAALAHEVLAVGPSLGRRAVELGLLAEDRVRVLGYGSSNGVDPRRFHPLPETERRERRRELGIPLDAPLVGFVGRMTRDKGVEELLGAMRRIVARRPEARLLLLGDPDATDPVPAETVRALLEAPFTHAFGFVEESARFIPLLDVLAFPSHREGFPNAPLEAAACAVPTVAFVATGTVDAVEDGRTGRLVPGGDTAALAEALLEYLDDPERRRRHGRAARERVLEKFTPDRVWSPLARLLEERLRSGRRRGIMGAIVKRAIDLQVGILGLIVLSPLLLAIALAIRSTMGSPVLFRQRRPGLQGRPFTLIKFRTMRRPTNADESDAERLTTLGRWLRRTSLDELPELVNVVRGEMSLVGPRPLLMEYLPLYSAEQSRRHEVKPGLTGWAQIHGRNRLSWQEKFRHDVWYVDHQSLWLDLRILAATAGSILSGRGVSAAGHDTMPRFEGCRDESDRAERAPAQGLAQPDEQNPRRSSPCAM